METSRRALPYVPAQTRPRPMQQLVRDYAAKLSHAMTLDAMDEVPVLGTALRDAWRDSRTVYLCGNGGSAGNAIHLANDFLYGVGIHDSRGGMHAEALCANAAVLTCLANDLGYDRIYSEQLRVKAQAGDVLIVLSGNELGMKTFAILAFSGGHCKELAQHPIHFVLDDMQIAEDLQLIIGHLCMQWLCANPIHGAAA